MFRKPVVLLALALAGCGESTATTSNDRYSVPNRDGHGGTSGSSPGRGSPRLSAEQAAPLLLRNAQARCNQEEADDFRIYRYEWATYNDPRSPVADAAIDSVVEGIKEGQAGRFFRQVNAEFEGEATVNTYQYTADGHRYTIKVKFSKRGPFPNITIFGCRTNSTSIDVVDVNMEGDTARVTYVENIVPSRFTQFLVNQGFSFGRLTPLPPDQRIQKAAVLRHLDRGGWTVVSG